MEFFCKIFILLTLISIGNGYIARIKAISDASEHPGKCHSLITRETYNPDEEFFDNESCTKYICTDILEFNIFGCAKLNANETCTVTPNDNGKPYPDCCPTLTCQL